MAINIPLSTLNIINGKIDKNIIDLVLEKTKQMGFINCSFDDINQVFKAGYKFEENWGAHPRGYGIYHTILIGISDNYVYINPFDRQHELVDYLKSIKSIIREDTINSIVYQ